MCLLVLMLPWGVLAKTKKGKREEGNDAAIKIYKCACNSPQRYRGKKKKNSVFASLCLKVIDNLQSSHGPRAGSFHFNDKGKKRSLTTNNSTQVTTARFTETAGVSVITVTTTPSFSRKTFPSF